ncbi:MAG: hypothetical protein GF353_12955 [Candidatus Lokiarchaeota archaeon]|nr:hypothetical protein [Candidatus Lokiarchaeota archaeon]
MVVLAEKRLFEAEVDVGKVVIEEIVIFFVVEREFGFFMGVCFCQMAHVFGGVNYAAHVSKREDVS